MSESYLSRARLRHDAPIAALRELLVPDEHGARIAAAHRLVWTLFGDAPDRRRDFLWREGEPAAFYILSARPPEDRHGLFHLDPPKRFEPVLAPGDLLAFALRANATVARAVAREEGSGARSRGTRADVVMDAIHALPKGERAAARHEVLDRVAAEWLARQGETHGFELSASRASGYRVLRVDRGAGRPPMRAGVLDIEGTLVVRDPERFVTAVRHGFGRAKAFGCGLMLIRRAR